MFLDHLLIDSRARSSKAFAGSQTPLSRLCAGYLRDVTYCHLLFTNRNVATYTQHVHLGQAQTRLRERLRQGFCSECDEDTCFVNIHMIRTILVHLHYVNRVSGSHSRIRSLEHASDCNIFDCIFSLFTSLVSQPCPFIESLE